MQQKIWFLVHAVEYDTFKGIKKKFKRLKKEGEENIKHLSQIIYSKVQESQPSIFRKTHKLKGLV